MQDNRIKNASPLLKIALLEKGDRTFDVRKQSSDKFPLLLEAKESLITTLVVQEPSTVFTDGLVGGTGCQTTGGTQARAQSRSALKTEVVANWIDRPANVTQHNRRGHCRR
jgi:hypothetical protein